MRVKIDTKLVCEDGVKTYSVVGILIDNQLKFREEDTTVVIDFSNYKMLREDNDKKIEYKFLESTETLNDLFLKSDNCSFKIPIVTELFDCMDNKCTIKYRLVLEDKVITYVVSWEEM